MHWKVYTAATTSDKANKVLGRVLKVLAVEHSSEKIEPYHKGGFVCSFNTCASAVKWPEIVLESLSFAQAIGRGWVLTGDIQRELDAWSNESTVVGVQSIHLVV